VIVDHGHTRPVFRVHDPEMIFESLWSSRGEVALVVGSKGHAQIVLDPGGDRQREIPYPQHDPGFPGTNDVAFTPTGELSYLLGETLVIRAPTAVIRTLPLHGWEPACWTPNGKLIVTAGTEDPLTTRIGAFDPGTGKVTAIGSVRLAILSQIVCPAT
jgi:hypothetical protein